MDNNSSSEAHFPGKRCLFSERALCPEPVAHAGICGLCGQRSWGVAASSHPCQHPILPILPHPALLLPFPPSQRHRSPWCVWRGGRAAPGSCFPGRSAVPGSVDQPRSGFHVDPAAPLHGALGAGLSWEPTKADHQSCLAFAGSRIAERLNGSEGMFHLTEVCVPGWSAFPTPGCALGPAWSAEEQSAACVMGSGLGLPGLCL